MIYLTEITESYRVDTEGEAANLIEAAKNDKVSSLKKYTSEHKERKSKGEIVDEWFKVTLVKVFNDEKDATTPISITYEVEDYI